MPQDAPETTCYEAYFDTIQSRKKLPLQMQERLTAAFEEIPASFFPIVPSGKVIEISADASVAEAVKILFDSKIMAAPVSNPDANTTNWRDRYLGIIGYSTIILWVLEREEMAKTPNNIGEDFYKEPFESTPVRALLKNYCWASFFPMETNSSMLSLLLLLSKYGLHHVPVIEHDNPNITNFITQFAVVQGLQKCKGRDWFDLLTEMPISDVGLPFMPPEQVVTVQSNERVLEAFKKMKDNEIGGVPVVEGPGKKMVGCLTTRDIGYLCMKPELGDIRDCTVMRYLESIGGDREMVTCEMNASLGSVIEKLNCNFVHRIHVVSGDFEVIGVITLRDVISCFIHEPKNNIN